MLLIPCPAAAQTPPPVRLDSIVVTATSRRLEGVGFYQRARGGPGYFLTRARIDSIHPQFASDVLQRVPGVRLARNTAPRQLGRMLTTGRGECRFRFIVDGTRTLVDFDIDQLNPGQIEGIEVYLGFGEVPATFRALAGTGTGPTCGVIVVWTRDR